MQCGNSLQMAPYNEGNVIHASIYDSLKSAGNVKALLGEQSLVIQQMNTEYF